jgi:hypothetical protein
LWVSIAGGVILLLGVGAFLFFVVFGSSDTAKTSIETPKSAPAVEQTNDQPAPAEKESNGTATSFKSTKLNIEFSHPANWTVKESADKEEVTVTSPNTAYTTKDGASKTGVFTLKFRNGVIPEAMQATVHAAVAVKDSEVIGYAAPTESQRHYTNLSYGGKDSKNFGFVIVTGNVAYKAGQPFGTSINLIGSAYVFAGGYGADEADALAFDAVPVSSFATPTYEQALGIIKSLKLY